VFRYHAGQLEELRESLPDPHVVALLAEEGAAWAGTPLGVVEFSEGRPRRTLADGFFARTLARRGETLHIGTEDEGIVEIPLGSRRAPRPVPEALTVRRLARLDSELFALTDDAIHRYEPARQGWERVLNSASAVLADRNIAALGASEGRLWVGYFDRGLDILPPELDRASHYEDDTLFCINRIVSSPLRGAAVATANGLVLFDSAAQPRQVMGRKEGLLADHVTDIAFRDGGMVVATGAGLSFVDRFGVRSLYAFHGLVNNHVYTVAAQGRRTVAGTLGGVSVLDGDVVRANYTTANSHLRHNWITALARVGDEWFAGTYGAGVLRFVPGGDWRRFTDLPEALVVNPNALLVSGGGVYAGTLDRGLFIYDRASGRWTGTTGGLPSLNVTALTSYGGYLYIGTDNGLVRMPAGALP
jgi:ligand-binding sensor domain-containing protein